MITKILNPCFYQRRTPFLGPPHSSGSLRAGRDGGKRNPCWITFKIGPRNSIALILLCVINLRLVLCKHLSVGWLLDFHLWVSCCQWESPLKRGWSYPPALQPLKFNTFKWIFPVPSPKAGEIALANFDDPGDLRIFGQATGAGPARARCSAESPSFDPSAGVAGVAGVAGPQISTRTLYNWKSPFEFWQSSIYKWDIIHSYVKLPGVGNVELWWGYAGIYNGIYSQQKWGYPDKAKLDPYTSLHWISTNCWKPTVVVIVVITTNNNTTITTTSTSSSIITTIIIIIFFIIILIIIIIIIGVSFLLPLNCKDPERNQILIIPFIPDYDWWLYSKNNASQWLPIYFIKRKICKDLIRNYHTLPRYVKIIENH